ncbi:MAG TPA: hypothetical protein VER55_15400 [Ardenticatenaceae bacterium]|nr:hypothetical protein [Ardenticatenaceae bacterium]
MLFVGESPPVGGTFFYQADSNLYRYTRAAFAAALGEEVGVGEAFLRFFRSHGCYLDDLCLSAVNGLDGPTRRRMRAAAVPSLAERMKRYTPSALVAVMTAIRPQVESAARLAGADALPFFVTRFPTFGHQHTYVAGLAEVLRTLRREGLLEKGPLP